MLKHYTDESHSALECLWEITRKLPDGVDLGSFSYRKGETIRITGEARLVDQIYNFKTALDESDLFVESVLQSVRRDRRKRREIFDIEIQLPEEEW
jgi:Tfp pilus assembly protein PilN